MNKRILVTYATRAGATAEIAQAIAENLAARGYAVDVKPVQEKPVLDGYSAVVLGSAIRMGGWLPEAVNFVKANQAALNGLPVALFTVHMLNTGDDEAGRTARAAYLNAVRPLLQGAEAVYFEGKMDFSRLSFLDRTIAKMVKAVEADHRDWDKIRQWAGAVWS
jgi:menaquinone-dependent protoporphyrinogen oxidase